MTLNRRRSTERGHPVKSWFRQKLTRTRRATAGRSPRALPNRNKLPLLVEELETRTLLSSGVSLTGLPTWTIVGPQPIMDAKNLIPASMPTSAEVGAVNALAVDPANTKHVFAATDNGGIWQTNDFTAQFPTWT